MNNAISTQQEKRKTNAELGRLGVKKWHKGPGEGTAVGRRTSDI